MVDAHFTGVWKLPIIGEVPAPQAVLIRPDGYVAWVSNGDSTCGLLDGLDTWFP